VTFCVLSDDSYENVIFLLFALIFLGDRHLFPVVSSWRRETAKTNCIFMRHFITKTGIFYYLKYRFRNVDPPPTYVQHVDNDAKRRDILCVMGHFCSKNKLTPRRYLHCTTANVDILSFVLFNDISISLDCESQTNIYIRGTQARAGYHSTVARAGECKICSSSQNLQKP